MTPDGDPSANMPVGFCNQGKDYQGNPSTCLADLVDDTHCYYPHFPMGDPRSDGGGTDHIGPGGGDAYDWANSSSGGGGGTTGTVTIGGITYNTVTIPPAQGETTTQNWLSEDIRHYVTGITSDTFSGYDTDSQANYYDYASGNSPYGLLYSKAAVTQIMNSQLEGYHVANVSDYVSLIKRLTGQTLVLNGSVESSNLLNLLVNGTTGMNIKLGGIYNSTAFAAKDSTECLWVPDTGNLYELQIQKTANSAIALLSPVDTVGVAMSIRLCKNT
jgi:hypothetical protein